MVNFQQESSNNSSLFNQLDGPDSKFNSIRNNTHQRENVKANVETLYHRTKEYLDKDLLKSLKNDFESHFWEMYLCGALLNENKKLVKRSSRKNKNSKGPDLLIKDSEHKIWIEAIAVQASDKIDVKEGGEIPNDKIKQKLTGAVRNKESILQDHIDEELIDKDDVIIIAINGKQIPLSQSCEFGMPRIVKSLYGIGNLSLQRKVGNQEFSETYYDTQKRIFNHNHSEIRYDKFLGTDYSHISAVLYSRDCEFSLPNVSASNFIVVKNPNADAKLNDGFLNTGREYDFQDGQLKEIIH